MTARRRLIQGAAAAVLLPRRAHAQAPRVHRIGYVFSIPRPAAVIFHEFVRGLRELGWVEGENISIDYRFAETAAQIRDAMAELVRQKVDVIVAPTSQQAFPAREATNVIPIVVLGAHAAVETGLVQSLPRPGGNVTGVESLAPELDAKRLEIVRELLPAARRVGLLYDPDDPGTPAHLRWAAIAAERLGLRAERLEAKEASAIETALAPRLAERLDAVLTFTDGNGFFFRHAKRLADIAARSRVPTIFEFRPFVTSGGLLSYGARLGDLWHRGAYYVDRLLKGARPSELPMEQVSRVELVVNQRTATLLGVRMPQSLLLRADEVIA